MDFVTQKIEPCVEEIATPYHLESFNEDISRFDLANFFSRQDQKFHQIIIRTQENPQGILDLIRDFAEILSARMHEDIGFGFGYQICRNQDWIEAYKRSIMPVCTGGFYIRPSWCEKSTKEGLRDLVIDPALAFGSGHHASTSMCLEFLGSMDLDRKRLLDVGCGSGILGIASSMLGASVEICDTDPLAIEESHKNFALNTQSCANSWVGSIVSASEEYDVIVANILASILVMLRGDFYTKLKQDGILILSGILNEYKDQVLDKFKDFKIDQILEKEDWVALKLIKLK